MGLAQASFVAAAALGPFAVVTGGTSWGPMLLRFARSHQLDAQLVGIHTVEWTGAQIAAAPEQAADNLCRARQLGIDNGACSIVLGGAALAGLASTLQACVSIPVLDNVLLGARTVVDALARDRTGIAQPTSAASPYLGLAPELARILG